MILKKAISFFPLHCCLLLVCMSVFSQTEVYKTNYEFSNFDHQQIESSFCISGDVILFSGSDYKLYSFQKEAGKINWEIFTGWKSNRHPFLYDAVFLFGKYKDDVLRFVQYSLKTGEELKELPFESINYQPHFLNNIMYCTAQADGGKLLAYDMNNNSIVWQKHIRDGIDFEPVYRKDKIIAGAGDDNWFDTGYDGSFIPVKSKSYAYLDTLKVGVKNYKFLTHDGKEISAEFLRKMTGTVSEYKMQKSTTNSFVITQKKLLILAINKQKVLQLELKTLLPADDFDPYSYSEILRTDSQSIWFYWNSHLLHYDFKNDKLLRKVNLTKWNPHQVVVEDRTIWLISKNDGQFYKLDFDPDKKISDMQQAKADKATDLRCMIPDPKMVEAAKAAKTQLKN